MGTECPECGESYRRLAQHWAMSSSCSYPALPERWLGLLTGILMGDGTIHDPPSAANTRVDVCNICVTFLQWVDEKLEWLSNGVTLHRTSDEIRAENARSDLDRISSLDYDIRDQYVLTTRRHPALNRYRHWYDSEKRYPAEQDLVRRYSNSGTSVTGTCCGVPKVTGDRRSGLPWRTSGTDPE